MRFSAGLIPLAIVLSALAAGAAQNRANLIAIVTDDQGRWAMGAYGNKEIQTPNLDRLAREGALFTRAFANTPVCSPSRATYLTGRYPTEVGITDYLTPDEAQKGAGLREPTWPAILQRAGYRTALIGKWHLGSKPQFHPTRLGFDYFMGFLGGASQPMNPTLEVEGKVKKIDGYLADILVDDAIAFSKANRERPFALCLHFREPHLPYGPVPEQDAAHYQELDPSIPALKGLANDALKATTKAYYASISSVDCNVGRLLRALDELGLGENTLIVFTSDHGYNEGQHYISTKGNGHWIAGGITGPMRPNMWDTSLMVPLVFRWPAVIKPGRKVDALVSNIDMFRTVLGALGVAVPKNSMAARQGLFPAAPRRGDLTMRRSLWPIRSAQRRARLHADDSHRTLQTRPFFHANLLDELYDLERDPDEESNLLRGSRSAEYSDTETRLRDKLLVWMKSIDDPLIRERN